MTFVDSQGSFPAPEFYTEYPIFVSESSPELEDFGSIYKLVPIEDINSSVQDINSLGLEIQLFEGDIGLKAKINSIDTYVLWSHTPDQLEGSPGFIITLEDGDFEFDSTTGILTITSEERLKDMLSKVISDIEKLRKDDEHFYEQQNWSYYVVFQVKVEKYRSITDLRDLTSEQIGKIATAQAIEAAILEYNYQFNLATQTQLSYHELIYTAIVTAVSTAITMGATFCIGQVVQLTGSLASTATKELSKSASKTLMGLLQPTAGFTASSVAWAVVREIGQEVLIDPWIESAVSGMVRRAGGDAMLQMVLSSVAESLRETLTGPFTNLFISQRSGSASFSERLDAKYFSKGLTPTVQDLLYSFNEYKSEINAQIEKQKEQLTNLGRGFKALTFVLGAVGFGVAQFLGPPTAMLYATLATYCFTEGIPLKNIFSKVFNPVMVAVSKVGDVVRNNKWVIINALGIGVIGAMISAPIAGILAPFLGPVLAPVAAGVFTIAIIPLMSVGMVRQLQPNKKTLNLPGQLRGNTAILNNRAWQLLCYIKDHCYPYLSVKDFWAKFGLYKEFHVSSAKHIEKSLANGREYLFSHYSLNKIRDVVVHTPSINTVYKTYIVNEIDYFLNQLSQSATSNQYVLPNLNPLQSDLINIFSNNMGRRNKPFNNREMTRLIYGPNVKEDLFGQQFYSSIGGVQKTDPTRYSINSLIFHISESPRIPLVVKILATTKLDYYGITHHITPDKVLDMEYDLYLTLSSIFTKDRPDLLPIKRKIFTLQGLSVLLTGGNLRYQKSLFSTGILGDTSGYKGFSGHELSRLHFGVRNLIIDNNLRELGRLAIDTYTSKSAKLKVNLISQGKYKRGLYGFGWYSPRLRAQRNQIVMREAYNLDMMTGEIIALGDGVAHHMRYDKSLTKESELIWVSDYTNLQVIKNPPKQKYFGAPVDFSKSPRAIESMNTLLLAKTAISKGIHAPHWADKNHAFYSPETIRRFYWNKYQVSLHGYRWLTSLQAWHSIPVTFTPQEYLDAL